MNNPLVSVIIPTYNNAHFIGRALQSVVDQTYENWEVIVVDNHSIDNTDEVISSFNNARIKVLKIHNNGIIASSRNKGIRSAKGEWIAFLDSDDWWSANKINIILDYVDKSDVFVAHPLKKIYNNKIKKINENDSTTCLPRSYKDLVVKGNSISTSSVMVKASVLNEIGLFNESKEYVASEDYDLWLRISYSGIRVRCVNQQLGYYRIHDNNYSSQDIQKYKSMYLVIKSNIDMEQLNFVNRFYVSILLSDLSYIIATNFKKSKSKFKAREYYRKSIKHNFFKIKAWARYIQLF